jgi:hypothetical protein
VPGGLAQLGEATTTAMAQMPELVAAIASGSLIS